LLKDPLTYEALSPELFGRTRSIVLGKHSGSAAVRQALEEAGIAATPAQMLVLLSLMRTLAQCVKRSISQPELIDLYDQTCKSFDNPAHIQEACA
jgi:homocitrate synthase NifV